MVANMHNIILYFLHTGTLKHVETSWLSLDHIFAYFSET